jgi:hypothetical protein
VIANWLAAIEHRTGLLWSDGVHPRPPGARLYARIVSAAVRATRRLLVTAPDFQLRPLPAGPPAVVSGWRDRLSP